MISSLKRFTVVLEKFPYSSDLTPSDCFLFTKLKGIIKGSRFEEVEAIEKAVTLLNFKFNYSQTAPFYILTRVGILILHIFCVVCFVLFFALFFFYFFIFFIFLLFLLFSLFVFVLTLSFFFVFFLSIFVFLLSFFSFSFAMFFFFLCMFFIVVVFVFSF